MSDEIIRTTSLDVSAPLAKVGTVWAAVGITSWSEFAAFLASIYTLLLIGEWGWKKFKGRRK